MWQILAINSPKSIIVLAEQGERQFFNLALGDNAKKR